MDVYYVSWKLVPYKEGNCKVCCGGDIVTQAHRQNQN